jgi:methionyl aminopeptidase
MKIYLKTEDEIELMRQANQLVGRTLGELAKHIKPGITTLQLDKIADEFIRDNGAIPTFKGFPNPYGGPFPANICTSVNDVVVHGVPNAETVLKEGDIISIDCGTLLNGFNGDSCYTFCVGEVSDEVKKLLRTTKESLYKGIENAVAGKHLGDISSAVQEHCEAQKYGIVRELTGHGIGREMHEDPRVLNYGSRGNGIMLKAGMCLAIEPMVTMGNRAIWMDANDRWTIRTRDGKPAAHFEHTIAVRKGQAEILSSFEEVESIELARTE